VQCGDIGSPGYTTNGPPRLVRIVRNTSGAQVTWHGVEGKRYRVEYRSTLPGVVWLPIGELIAPHSLPTMTDPTAIAGQRFYRVVEVMELP
jgi:hypothetical protein